MLKLGIVGLGQVGKTTLFRILTRVHSGALAMGRPEAHVGVLEVPDQRLDRLAQIYNPKRIVHGKVEYVDTPGNVIELARAGPAMASLREMDALAHVVKAFDGNATSPVATPVELRRDIENVELELILSDLALVEKRLERLEKDIKKQKNPVLEKEYQVLQIVKGALEKQTPLREVKLGPEEERAIRGFTFLSLKPMLYVFNLGEKDAARANAADQLAEEIGLKQRLRTAAVGICGKIEAELAQLADSEAAEFLASYGLAESATARLIRSSYRLLGLISFFTIDGGECRAWTIRSGTTALEAAGEVHSDIQKGFIRAEVVKFDDLVSVGSFAEARNRGLLRLEGKEYVIHDGEVVHFRHSA